MLKNITKIITILILFSINIFLYSAGKINLIYELSFENRSNHEAFISITIENNYNPILHLNISRYSPGRYSYHNFNANIYGLKAFDDKNNEIKIKQLSSNEWEIKSDSSKIKINYILFADRLDGTYSSVDTNYAMLNAPSAFLWIKELENNPIFIKINKPKPEWKTATQLNKISDTLFSAPNLIYFMDSPILTGNILIKEWEKKTNGKTNKFIFALNNDLEQNKLDELIKLIDKGIDEEIKIFGDLPEFENNQYIFLANYISNAIPDGMEHRNSSVLTRFNTIDDYTPRLVTTIYHEFFHSWLGKRIVSKSLSNFNLMKENLSDELWFIEGFTKYFSDLIARKTNLIDDEALFYRLTSSIYSYLNSETKKYFSAVDISHRASIFDGADHLYDQTNTDLLLSHYDIGFVIAFYLDLTLRIKYETSLDFYIKLIWDKFGKNEIPYGIEDLKNCLSILTNDNQFARNFFDRYIIGKDKIDFNSVLKDLGLLLKNKNPRKATLGNYYLSFEDDKIELMDKPPVNSPLNKIGLRKGDKIISLNGKIIKNYGQYNKFFEGYNPENVIEIVYKQKNDIKKSKVKLEKDSILEIVKFEDEKMQVNEKMIYNRKNWIGIIK